MFRIRRFGVIRTANIVAAMYLVVIAVIFVPILAIIAAIGARSGLGGAGGVGVLLFGLLAAVLYAAVGWVATAIVCVLYNALAGMVGGIEIELEAVEPPPPAAGFSTWGTSQAPPEAPPAVGAPPDAPPRTPPAAQG